MTTEPRQAMEPAANTQPENEFITGRLRLAGLLIVAGVLAQGLSLVWHHPLSFLAFLGVGGSPASLSISLPWFLRGTLDKESNLLLLG